MEIKVLFYIIAIIGWLVFKFFEKQKELFKKVMQPMEPPVAAPINQPIERFDQKKAKLPVVKKPLKQQVKNKATAILEKKQPEIIKQLKNENEFSESSETSSLIEEIRSGNTDWRKAIILSEILRPV